MRKLSIVVPVYFNELNLPDTVPQLLALAPKLAELELGLELVFVDDGSGDRSLAILREFQVQHPERIQVVKLTRNFGSMAAIQAGLEVASGDCVTVISADLQDPPDLIVEMAHHWRKGTKTVLAVRTDRKEPLSQRAFASVYYGLMRRYAIPGYPPGGFDFMLIDRQVVEELRRAREKNTNIMSLVFWLGHHPVMIPYVRRGRDKGKSRWTLSKKIKLFIDSFVAFSYVPLRAASALGLLLAVAAFIYGAGVVIIRMTHGVEVQGWTALVVLLTFTSGVQLTMLGVLGEYLWRVLDASRNRPGFVIDEVFSASRGAPVIASALPSRPLARP